MKALREMEPSLGIPRFRAWLIKVHRDLFTVHRYVEKYSAYYPEELTNVEKLTLALEDRRFLKHKGVDMLSALREIMRALTFRRHGGASTIDMQFVRTATGYKERTFSRKLYEMFLAVLIQFRYSKVVILRSYLHCAYFGSHRPRGVIGAAKKVFQKHAYDLTLEEAAFIAAMLVYPRPRNPTDAWKLRVERRARYGVAIYLANKKRFDQPPRREVV